MRIKAEGANFKVIEHDLGQLEKQCSCGWSSMNFYGLTANQCPKCHESFKQKVTIEEVVELAKEVFPGKYFSVSCDYDCFIDMFTRERKPTQVEWSFYVEDEKIHTFKSLDTLKSYLEYKGEENE